MLHPRVLETDVSCVSFVCSSDPLSFSILPSAQLPSCTDVLSLPAFSFWAGSSQTGNPSGDRRRKKARMQYLFPWISFWGARYLRSWLKITGFLKVTIFKFWWPLLSSIQVCYSSVFPPTSCLSVCTLSVY